LKLTKSKPPRFPGMLSHNGFIPQNKRWIAHEWECPCGDPQGIVKTIFPFLSYLVLVLGYQSTMKGHFWEATWSLKEPLEGLWGPMGKNIASRASRKTASLWIHILQALKTSPGRKNNLVKAFYKF
jgi:hypothetical protein